MQLRDRHGGLSLHRKNLTTAGKTERMNCRDTPSRVSRILDFLGVNATMRQARRPVSTEIFDIKMKQRGELWKSTVSL